MRRRTIPIILATSRFVLKSVCMCSTRKLISAMRGVEIRFIAINLFVKVKSKKGSDHYRILKQAQREAFAVKGKRNKDFL